MFSTALPRSRDPWHDGAMPKRSTPKRDFMEVARGIVEQAIGEQMDGNPLPESHKRRAQSTRGEREP
jgi:hypothetical protein